MALVEMLPRDLDEGDLIRVGFTEGEPVVGKYMGYNYADENEEGIASIDIKISGSSGYCGLMETEIASVEKI